MIPQAIIQEKRDRGTVSPEDLTAFLQGYLEGHVAEYQMSAFLMATFFRGMREEEMLALLEAMVSSGAVLEWPDAQGPVVDKHSTGGVGDKVSLALAPVAAELGLVVPMISGRGLGHTGGTLDKLAAIDGFRTQLTLDEFREIVGAVGTGMIGQTPEIAPLDRRLYDLRNVTATVPVPPLIAASIMSKKMAEGLEGLVLDVKVGEGAFLKDESQSRDLAALMCRLGEARGIRTVALLTAMDRPLGQAVGNALETAEAVDCLRGGGPQDLRAMVVRQAAEMQLVGGLVDSTPAGLEVGEARAEAVLDSGEAFERFLRLVELQGGDPAKVQADRALPTAPQVGVVTATEDGLVRTVSPMVLGEGVVELGGGRSRLDEPIDLAVGFRVLLQPGQAVARGDALAEVHARDSQGLERGKAIVEAAFEVGQEPLESLPLILDRIVRD